MKLHEIKDQVSAGYYTINIDKEVPILPDDYIFNDKKSVTFNKEMVAKHNRIMQKKRKKLLDKQEELTSLLISNVCSALMDDFGISHKQALECHKWALEKSNSSLIGSTEYFDMLEDAMQLLAGIFSTTIGE